MGQTKKHAKGRLDKWYKLAKERGYRARAAFKLIQLNRKYGFLENSKVLIDLCASPGSWCQVAAETMPVGSLIVGCDLSPIKPISRVITFQSDITTEKCRATLRQHLKSWKADVVLHDGAPNVGTAWAQDAYDQAELVLESLRLATEFLIEGGTFVTKVFRSKDYNSLLWIFNQLFDKVEATKPPSSRNVSAEIFVVCRGFKAPKRIDPRFLDPKAVFAELAAPTPNNEAKVYKPEVKKRKRDGYEEGEYLQFKELSASEFIHTTDPIAVLANYNRLHFVQPPNGDVALAALDKLPETTSDIRISCNDLKVLGRKEFKALLRWRLRVRDLFGLSTKKAAAIMAEVEAEVAEVESMDEEMKIQHDLEALRDKENAKKKREKRKENEKRQKEIVRMQMNMTAPLDIGKEQARPNGEGAMFGLRSFVENQAFNKISRGRMAVLKTAEPKKDTDSGIGLLESADDEDGLSSNDDDGDQLEHDLDNLYDNYKERKAESDAKYRAKKARQEHDDEWDGLSVSENAESEDSFDLEEDEDSNDESDSDDNDVPGHRGLTDLMGDVGLSEKAQSFFEQDVFKAIPGLENVDEVDTSREARADDDMTTSQVGSRPKSMNQPDGGEDARVTTRGDVEDDEEEEEWQDEPNQHAKGPIDIDVVTEEAMTLAQQLASGQKTRQAALDDGFNKYAFRDRDGLPDWFLDDESRHDKPHKPITKAAAVAIKEKLRALNARPIKKVREAKARKKFKMAQKLEKLRKKSDMLANEEGMTEKEKADSISRLLSKAGRQKPKQPRQLIIARGPNKGIKGRPSGVAKGRRYKLVDARMKKELRAQKRLNKVKKR